MTQKLKTAKDTMSIQFIKASEDVTQEALKFIALTPTKELPEKVEAGFFKKLTDEDFMQIAVYLAEKSYKEGGCPIGAVVLDNDTHMIMGKGHNQLVQNDDPLCHGETAAIRDAGRIDFSQTTLFTTLSPCGNMCTPSIVKLGFNRVVIGDSTNVDNGLNENKLRDAGVKVAIKENQMGIDIYAEYREKYPDQDLEDWMGLAAVNAQKTCC